jgi:hypothetical protein
VDHPHRRGSSGSVSAEIGFCQKARADTTVQNLRRQFVLGMRDLGYVERRDYLLEERYAAGQLDSFPAYARELVELPVNAEVGHPVASEN